MNWRGIFGIYAGFAIVLGGGWLWMRMGAMWTLGVIALGIALAVASIVQIVLARRGPRPANAPKLAKVGKTKASAAAIADAEDMDAAVRARMAAIAGRSSGRMMAETPTAEVEASAAVEHFPADPIEPEAAEFEHVVAEVELPAEVDEHEVLAAVPDLETHDVDDAWSDAEPVEAEGDEEAVTTEAWAAAEDNGDDLSVSEIEALENVADETETEPVTATDAEDPLPMPVGHVSAAVAEPVMSLDRQPGFPWTARYIALWAQEARESCPEPFRDAVAHWQRWAVQQNAATPIVAEAAEEFRAMIDIWRSEFGAVPELEASDWPVRQLYREAEDDAALASLLPVLAREAVA